MSAQEFFQGQSFDENARAASARPYKGSTQNGRGAVPKEVPAAGPDEPLGHSDYQDDYHNYQHYQQGYAARAASRPGWPRLSAPAPDGDAFERRFRSGDRGSSADYPRRSAFSRVRSGRRSRVGRRLALFILLGALLLGPLLSVLGAILAVGAVLALLLVFSFALLALLALPYLLYRLNRRRYYLRRRWRNSWW